MRGLRPDFIKPIARMFIHTLFDFLAWLTSLATLLVLGRTWFVAERRGFSRNLGYLAAVLFGAGVGAWVLGTANLHASGLDQSGRSIEGALFGAIVAVEIFKKWNGVSTRTGAIYALPVALGIAVGRIGCQLSGLEDFTYGVPTGTGWGWDFGDGINRHPVALYESALMAAFAIAYGVAIVKGSGFVKANGFYLLVAYYGVERFVLEFWKPYEPVFAGLTVFQCLSLVLLAYGLLMIASDPWMKQRAARQTGSAL